MGVLRICLFGTVQVSHGDRRQDTRAIHGVQGLLAYLVLHRRRSHAREALTGLFWGDHTETRARSCLSTALWRLRRLLEPPGVTRGTYLVTSRIGEVGFNCDSEHWVDVAAFEHGVQRRPVPDWSGVESAITHYTGDLLEGFYEDWALRERERLRLLYLDTLGRVLRHHLDSDDLEAALACGQRILEMDPLREEIHRELIRLHLRGGHRAHALRQYQICRDLLARELGIEPMEETQALYDEIVSGGRARPRRPEPAAEELLPPLRSAASGLDEARLQIARAIRLLDP
jgi:DNA-binding SARP family transcriptional activator